MDKLDIKDWDIQIRVDLYEAGMTEDGETFTAECYYVTAKRSDGKLYTHNKTYYGAGKEETPNGYYFYPDIRQKSYDECTILLKNIKDNGTINLDNWLESEPSYGSEYYCKKYGF